MLRKVAVVSTLAVLFSLSTAVAEAIPSDLLRIFPFPTPEGQRFITPPLAQLALSEDGEEDALTVFFTIQIPAASQRGIFRFPGRRIQLNECACNGVPEPNGDANADISDYVSMVPVELPNGMPGLVFGLTSENDNSLPELPVDASAIEKADAFLTLTDLLFPLAGRRILDANGNPVVIPIPFDVDVASCSPNCAISETIPEPSTWLLFATGLCGLIGYGWRRRKQAERTNYTRARPV